MDHSTSLPRTGQSSEDDHINALNNDLFNVGDHAVVLVDVEYCEDGWLLLARGEIVTVLECLPDGRVRVDNGNDYGVTMSPEKLVSLEIPANDWFWVSFGIGHIESEESE